MKNPMTARLLLAVAVYLSVGCFAPSKAEAQRRKKPRLDWATNVLVAMEEARLRNVPIVLHIHGDT